MIKETPVLQQGTIMRISEDADLRIGKHEAAHQIVSQPMLDRIPERLLSHGTPGFAGHFLPGNQWLEHRIPEALGEHTRQRVESFQLLVLSGVSGQLTHRPAAYL